MNELKIAVVDDDIYYLNLFKQQLLNIQCENVTIFENGTDFLNQLEEKFEVVFLDYQMDDLNGEEVLNKIKRYDPNVFVVIVSAQEDIKNAVEVLKKGAFDYLQKGDDELNKLKDILTKINQVKDMMNDSKPGILKRLFK